MRWVSDHSPNIKYCRNSKTSIDSVNVLKTKFAIIDYSKDVPTPNLIRLFSPSLQNYNRVTISNLSLTTFSKGLCK